MPSNPTKYKDGISYLPFINFSSNTNWTELKTYANNVRQIPPMMFPTPALRAPAFKIALIPTKISPIKEHVTPNN